MTADYRLPTRPKLIAAIPAYDEEKYIGTIVLKTRQYVDEVIVVDDGSTDNTSSVASLAGATVIRHDKNMGKGAAIQSILAEARKKSPDKSCPKTTNPSLFAQKVRGFRQKFGQTSMRV